MFITKLVETTFVVCDLCGAAKKDVGYDDKENWFCNSICKSYFYFPTKEGYIESKRTEKSSTVTGGTNAKSDV